MRSCTNLYENARRTTFKKAFMQGKFWNFYPASFVIDKNYKYDRDELLFEQHWGVS